MGVVRFAITFDKPNKVYHPGQKLTGRVELVLDSAKKIRGVELKIKGEAKCRWTESESYTDSDGESRTRTITKESQEVYINNKIILCGGKGKFELERGEHNYPFAVVLPHQLPSSFSGSYGSIGYRAKAKIDIPMAFDKSETQWFTVINLLNLNNIPTLRTPYKKNKEKTFCCLCCASGPLTMIFLLPKTGFAISESIPITIQIDNASNVPVDTIHVHLKRTIQYHAEGSTKSESTKWPKLYFGAVGEGQSYTCSKSLPIPQTNFPNFANCSIIKSYHELLVEVEFPDLYKNLKTSKYVTIGDIPLEENPNAPIIDPNTQPCPKELYPPKVRPNAIPADPKTAPFMVPEANPPVPRYPNRIPVPGTAQQVLPPSAPSPQILPNANFVPPDPYPSAGVMPPLPAPGYPQQNSNSGVPSAPPPPIGIGNPTEYSYSPQPAVNPECVRNTEKSDFGFKSDCTGNDFDFSLPAFTTSDIQIEKSTFLSDTKRRDEDENKATPFTPLSHGFPSAPPTS